jgi:hypothetical protein
MVLPIVVSFAVLATIVIIGDVPVTESIIVSSTVKSANLASDSEAVAVPLVINVSVVAVNEYGAVKNDSIKLPEDVPAPPRTPCPRGNQSIDVLVVCIAHRRLALSVTLPLSLASASVPLVRSEADVVAIPPPETPTST